MGPSINRAVAQFFTKVEPTRAIGLFLFEKPASIFSAQLIPLIEREQHAPGFRVGLTKKLSTGRIAGTKRFRDVVTKTKVVGTHGVHVTVSHGVHVVVS